MLMGKLFDKISCVITWSSMLKLVEKVTLPGNCWANNCSACLMERLPIWDNNLSTEISKGVCFNVNAICKERGQAARDQQQQQQVLQQQEERHIKTGVWLIVKVYNVGGQR